MQLSKLQKQSIGKLLVDCVQKAAASLSEITAERVVLSVPKIQLINSKHFDDSLVFTEEKMTAVEQPVEGAIEGGAFFLLAENSSLDLIRAMVHDSSPQLDLTEMDEAALTEIGNVIINNCINCLTVLFGKEIRSGLPQYRRNRFKNIFLDLATSGKADFHLLLLKIDFHIDGCFINGYIAFMLTENTMDAFLQKLNALIDSTSNQSG